MRDVNIEVTSDLKDLLRYSILLVKAPAQKRPDRDSVATTNIPPHASSLKIASPGNIPDSEIIKLYF